MQRAGWRALSEARLSLSVPSPISFSSRADMRSKSACDPEYLWCAAVLYCPATNAESASDESSSSVPEAYSEPPCCRGSRQPSGGARPPDRCFANHGYVNQLLLQHWRCRTCQGPAGLLPVLKWSTAHLSAVLMVEQAPPVGTILTAQRLLHPAAATTTSLQQLTMRGWAAPDAQASGRRDGSRRAAGGITAGIPAANSPPQQVLRVHLPEGADLGV